LGLEFFLLAPIMTVHFKHIGVAQKQLKFPPPHTRR